MRCSIQPGLYQVSPSNQQNVETTSYQGILANQVCTNICNSIFFRRNNYHDNIDVSQTNKLSHWINDWMDDSRHYMAGWCANIILTTSTHGTYITPAVNTICTRGYLTNNEYNVHARLLPTRLSYAWSRSPGRRRRHFVRTSVDDDDDGM